MSDEPPKVGYGHPPEHTKFKPRQSGNPKGRPKGSQNFTTVLSKELSQKVSANVGGQKKKIPLRTAIAKQVAHKAAAGDPKAIGVVIQHDRAQEAQRPSSAANIEAFNKLDEIAIRSLMARIVAFHEASIAVAEPEKENTAKPERPRPS